MEAEWANGSSADECGFRPKYYKNLQVGQQREFELIQKAKH
jgi:hypothetical protein